MRYGLNFILLAAVLAGAGDDGSNLIYVSTNNPQGNVALLLKRGANGAVETLANLPANGTGFGGNLESQSPLTLSQDGRTLFTVNAASNTVSTFRVRDETLEFAGVYNSGGIRPTSLTERRNTLYVMNEGAGNNISGFNVGTEGVLFPLSGSTFPLTREGAGGAQVAFHPTFDVLLVSERFSNRLGVYSLDTLGQVLRGPREVRSAGRFPFGFAFTSAGSAVVSEAFGGRNGGSATSSYSVNGRGRVRVRSRSVSTREIAACWVAITPDSRYAYVTNTGSNSITGYRVARNGTLKLLNRNGIAIETPAPSAPTEAAINPQGTLLFVIYQARSVLGVFAIGADGALTAAGEIALPLHPVGLAIR